MVVHCESQADGIALGSGTDWADTVIARTASERASVKRDMAERVWELESEEEEREKGERRERGERAGCG